MIYVNLLKCMKIMENSLKLCKFIKMYETIAKVS